MTALNIQQAMELAVARHRAGELGQAEQLYRSVLAQQPNNANALHLLGLVKFQAGNHKAALEWIGRAIVLNPNVADYHLNQGVVLDAVGQTEIAVHAYRKALALRPNIPETHANLGNALRKLGILDEAAAACRRALELRPDYFEAQLNLGNVLQEQGKIDEAISAFDHAARIRPDLAEAHHNLGNALAKRQRFDEAIAAQRRALQIKPDFAQAANALGVALRDKPGSTELDAAVVAFRQAVAIKPDMVPALLNLAHALRENASPSGVDEAMSLLQQAAALPGHTAETRFNLGVLFNETKQIDAAIASFEQATRLAPDHVKAHNNLGNALKDAAQIDAAIASFRQAIAIKPDYVAAHDNLLYALHFQPDFDVKGLLAESRRWNLQHAEPLRKLNLSHTNDRNPNRRLRIGYVSPDFRDHAVSRFVLPWLAAHDHQAFEILGYAQVANPDKVTAKLKACCDHWRSMVGVGDEQAAEMIRRDKIDILIDLAGHTADNRLLVFAHKPAPVQVTWLGYPGTTGLSAMDYRFTDAHADPPGRTDEFCSEQLIRLPQTAWCFAPPDGSPTVNESPAIANGHVTFGSFNNFAKVNEALLKLWVDILRAAPSAKLLLKAGSLGCASVQRQVRRSMSEAGIEPDRLELLGWVASGEHLAQYHRVDFALDTFPYHGTTTTCESLWMGVPVVSLAGDSHVSRVGVSLLSNIGLPEMIADSREKYVRIAADLANDIPRLSELRRTLRSRMQASPLMDAAGFARDVEAAYRTIWRSWCAG